MTQICRDCKVDMIQTDEDHFECPKCKHSVWIISMSLKELKGLGRQAYLDGRHWNRGGGVNK